MAAKDKKELELLLNGLDLSSLGSKLDTRRLVTVELLWPRVLVATKSSVKTVKLAKGLCAAETWPWYKRILFKESVENHFGIQVKVSESMTANEIRNFLRFFASSLFKVGGDYVDEAFPGGDIAAIPLEYGYKQLKTAKDPEIIAEGGIDFEASELPESLVFEVPLLCTKALYAPPDGKQEARTRKLIHPAETQIGKAVLSLKCL